MSIHPTPGQRPFDEITPEAETADAPAPAPAQAPPPAAASAASGALSRFNVGPRPIDAFAGARFATIKENPDGSIDAAFGAGVDMTGRIHADPDGNFSWEMHPVMMRPGPLRPMTDADRASLAADLQKFIDKNPDVDPAWQDLQVEAAGQPEPTPVDTFGGARFASITENDDGTIDATFGAGVDMTGRIHADADGNLSWETHPVMMRPGPLRPMTDADRASLAANLQNFVDNHPDADPNWQDLLGVAAP